MSNRKCPEASVSPSSFKNQEDLGSANHASAKPTESPPDSNQGTTADSGVENADEENLSEAGDDSMSELSEDYDIFQTAVYSARCKYLADHCRR